MFSAPQYSTSELQQYNYFVMQEPVFEEKIEEPVFTCMYEENGVLYCASTTSERGYYYTYALNNPLSFVDPSGYRPEAIFEEEARLSSGRDVGGIGGGYDPFGWINKWGHSLGFSRMTGPNTDWDYSAVSNSSRNKWTGEVIYHGTDKERYNEISKTESLEYNYWMSGDILNIHITGIESAPIESAANNGGAFSYNQRVSEISLGIDISAGVVETAGRTTAIQLGTGAKGLSVVSKIGRGAGTVGFVIAGVHAGYEIKTGNANTHTVIDLGVTALAATAVGVGVIVSSPVIITGAAIGGAAWGIYSLFGGGKSIDNRTNNWGRDNIFYRNR